MKKFAAAISQFTIAGIVLTGCVFQNEYAEAKECLAMNVYHEARGESIEGQYAVAHVTMNRVKDSRWADNVCDVVYQPYQFSWTHTISNPEPKDRRAWDIANEVAKNVLDDKVADNTGGADHYHADWVSPSWATSYEKVKQIGVHIFYR